MQRIEVKFSEEEYLTMENWIKNKGTVIKEIEKEIFIKGEEEKFLFNFSKVECGVGILLKVNSNIGHLISDSNGVGLRELTFRRISDMMGVFSLYRKYLEEEVIIKFTKEYEENGYYKNYKEYSQSKLNTIKYFTQKVSLHNLFNIIKYFDFENKEDLSLAIHSYVNHVCHYSRVMEKIERFIKIKLEMLGYERNPKLKDKLPIYEKKDEDNLEIVSPKSLDYAFENLLEVFYKLVNGYVEEDASEVEKYSYILTDYFVSNNRYKICI